MGVALLFAGSVAAADDGTGPKAASTSPAASASEDSAVKDELPNAGYVPGYRTDKALGVSPYAPRVGGLPGGTTPAYGSPTPPNEWNFHWSGFLTTSLQFSTNERPTTIDGQSKTVVHVPPQTVDEYASFLGTNTMPGEWAQMNFATGNRYVTANVMLTTWNPTEPTTYFQHGSQQFINNAYMAFTIPPIAGVSLRANVGYFYNVYGGLGQYGLGLYTNPLVGGVRGVGENLVAEYDLSDSMTLSLEHGVMGTRNGMAPTCPVNLNASPANCLPVTVTGQNGMSNVVWPAAWVHHAHVGLQKKGEPSWHVKAHYLYNWSQDDRTQLARDNPNTRQIDESNVKDGSITTYGLDAALQDTIWGYLGAGVSYTHAQDAYPVKGIVTYGGDGETLTNRWFGQPTGGTGNLLVAGVNYAASLGRLFSYPVPFTPGPDITVQLGFVVAKTWGQPKDPAYAYEPFDGRVRHKYGADVQYMFLPIMGAALRVDRVVPSSKDSEETFHVISPRLIFKSGWDSRYTITLIYGKWLYGSHTHPEASSVTPGDRLDDQLFALNAQMGW